MKKKSNLYVAIALTSFAAVAQLVANPENPTVIEGDVSFSTPVTDTLQVSSDSAHSIVEWEGFSISASETTHFELPSSSSAILNRVTSSEMSDIAGQITSNGHVYLINPNGILIEEGAQINTAGFLGSAMDCDNQEFLDGNEMTFSGSDDPNFPVLNVGTITANDGDVILLGFLVESQGTLIADNGTVALAGATDLVLQPANEDRIAIVLHSYASKEQNSPGVNVGGTIAAIRTELRADGNAYALAINHDGIIYANGTSGNDAVVTFEAPGGSTAANGIILATNSDNTGGTVNVLGDEVELKDSCAIDASGAYGGGVVNVGGGWGGQDPTLINADNVNIFGNALVDASATYSGQGGTVVCWADETMTFRGTLNARGGDLGGDGGDVEVSGVQDLIYEGTVDVSAPNGDAGTLTLDPQNLIYMPREVLGVETPVPFIIMSND